MRRQADLIEIYGVNGDHCIISHSQWSWGPFLAPKSTGLFDMAIQTNWGTSSFGQFYSSWKPKRRDVVWTMHIMNPETGLIIDEDSDLWHTIYSRYKAMFSPAAEAQIVYTSIDGARTLGLRTLKAPQSVSSQNFEGGDPHLIAYGSVVQTMAAELPFYVGTSEQFSWSTGTSGNYWFNLPYYNPSTVDIWPEYDLSGGVQWTIPDYSFGNEAYGRGKSDREKTVPVPALQVGEDTTIMTRPDMEWAISVLDTNPGARSPGLRNEYPIIPGAGSIERGCVILANGVPSGGAQMTLTLPRWYAEPFSTPLVTA